MSNDFVNKIKIIFVGMPDMAAICLSALIKKGFQITAVIPPHKSHPSAFHLINFARIHKLPVYEFQNSINEPLFIEKIQSLNADIGVICSFDKLLSKEFLATTKEGYINCHPSLLPDYRGANPYYHMIKNGEKNSGVTLHFADENFDTGEIIAQETVPLDDRETMGTLFNRTNFIVAQMLCDTLEKYERTRRLFSRPQSKRVAQKAPKINGEIKIDWSMPVEFLERQIRAANPFFNCLTSFRGTMFKIISTDYKIKTHRIKFGKITKVEKNKRMEIAANGGFLYPKVIQIGTWGIFDIAEFMEKFNPQPGEELI